MRPSLTLDACGLALGVALLSLHVGEAFLCPTAVLGSSRESMTGTVDRQQQQRRLAVKRAVGRMSLDEEGGQGDGSGLPCALPLNENASGAARKGPLRRLKSLVGRKTATAAAVSALLSAGTPGRAEALFGRGKTPEAPPVPALEQRLQDGAEALEGASEGLMDAVEGLGVGEESEGDAGAAVVDGDATGLLAEGGSSLPTDQGTDGTIPSPSTSTTSAEGFQQEALAGVSSSSSSQSSSGGSAVAARKSKEGSAAGGGVMAALEEVRGVVSENKEIAAVAIAGAAGATVLVSRSSGGGGGSSRGRKGSKRAPKSPLGGFGKPRVSPEVAAADAKRKADSLKKVNFEVDLELFGDAVSDFPVRPPPPAPPAPEPVPSPSETIQGAMAARDAVAEEDVLEASAGAGSSVTVAAEESAVESPPLEAAVEAPEEAKKQDKPKRKGPMMNLFKRDSGPQRSTTMDEAMCAETADVATFRQATAAVLARSAPQGSFDVRTPRALEEATTTAGAEGEAEGDEAAASGRVAALTSLMQTAGLSTTEAADAVADVVNAMVVSLVDDAVTSKDEEATGKAADALLDYMDGAGALFVSLCPGVELKPQIKYNGSFKRGKLEKVFEAAARTSLKMGDEGQMGKLDRLQDLFSIKEAKASSITQKIMMELMMKMMSEGGGEDTEGLEKMMGGMPGMGARSPEDHKQEVAALKAMVESGECPKEEVDGLRKMYKDAGMDIDTLVNDPMMESSMDADAKEVVVLLRKLLALWPKT